MNKLGASIKDEVTTAPVQWDEEGWHFSDASDAEILALYILVLSSLNFCFWPAGEELQYEHLAKGLRDMVLADKEQFDSMHLLSGSQFIDVLNTKLPHPLPNSSERARLVQEIGYGLINNHNGSALALLSKAENDASKLVSLIAETFPGFRDEAISMDGKPLFFYKRAQICVGDLYGAFGNKYPCEFGETINELTTFADYRVPQMLRDRNVIVYDDELEMIIDGKVEIAAGSAHEHSIRAATIVAVEKLAKIVGLSEFKLDWYLWQQGELLEREGKLRPHHRTRTIFY